MALKMSILSLLGLVAVVASNPFGFGLEIGGKSQLGGGASAGGKVGAGVDEGLNVGGKGEAEVHGGWIKPLFGKVYVANKEGKDIGVGGSVGSDLILILYLRHYRAGGDVHLGRDKLSSAVYNARTFTNTQDESYIDSKGGEAIKPKYTKCFG